MQDKGMFKNWCMGNENLVWRENLLGGLFHLPPPSRDSFPLSFLVDHTKIQKCLDHSIQKTRFKFTWFFHTIVRKGVPASLFKAPTPWSNFSPFLKSLFSFPFFLFHSLLKYFRQIPPPLQPPSALIQPPTNYPWFKQISNGWFYPLNCRFLSKINF